jgi:hypothetical protein
MQPVRKGVEGDDGGRWLDAGGTRVVFSAVQHGPSDLWSVDLGGGRAVRLTFGIGSERLDDVAPAGSALTFHEQRDAAALWLLAKDGTTQQLTFENAMDLWPSASDAGDVLVFQRSESADSDSLLYGAPFFRLRSEPGRAWSASPLAARGGDARVSPEGRYLAHLRLGASSPWELWIEDLASEHAWCVATDVLRSEQHVFPVERAERMAAWGRQGPTLYWAARRDGRCEVRRWRAGAGPECETVVTDATADRIADVHVSPDDRRLAWVRSRRGTTMQSELRCRDVDGDRDLPLPAITVTRPDRLSLLGWLDARTLLVARTRTNPDWTDRIELSSVEIGGKVDALGVVDRAFVGTARLSRPARTLFLTACSEDGVHDVRSLDLHTGRLVRVTDNPLHGVSFAGITPFPDGSAVFVRHERTESIWLVRIEGGKETKRSESWLRRITSST